MHFVKNHKRPPSNLASSTSIPTSTTCQTSLLNRHNPSLQMTPVECFLGSQKALKRQPLKLRRQLGTLRTVGMSKSRKMTCSADYRKSMRAECLRLRKTTELCTS